MSNSNTNIVDHKNINTNNKRSKLSIKGTPLTYPKVDLVVYAFCIVLENGYINDAEKEKIRQAHEIFSVLMLVHPNFEVVNV